MFPKPWAAGSSPARRTLQVLIMLTFSLESLLDFHCPNPLGGITGKTIPLFDKGFNMLAFWTYTQENGGVWAGPYYTPTGWGLFNINIRTGEITDTPIKGDPLFAYGAVYSPDRTKAYSVMDEVGVIDLKTHEVTKVVPIEEGTCYGNVPTSDGKRLFVGAGGSTVTVYDTETMKPLRVLQMKTDGMILRRMTY